LLELATDRNSKVEDVLAVEARARACARRIEG
jgi:hypothetical protein